MFRKTFSVILFSLFSLTAFSQGKVEGGFYAGYFQLGDRGFNNFGGMLHVPVGERATLNYSLGMGTGLNGGLHVHCTGGMVAGFWILDQLDGGNLDYLAFLLCLVPEGVGVYLPQKGKIATHVSINPLSVEYFYKSEGPHEEWAKLGCDVVARFKIRSNLKWPVYFAPQVAATVIYTPGETTSQFGFKAGFTLGLEKKD
jgi:hypothetical protein